MEGEKMNVLSSLPPLSPPEAEAHLPLPLDMETLGLSPSALDQSFTHQQPQALGLQPC